MSGEQQSDLFARLRAANRAVMALYGPIRALEDPHAAALLEQADASLRKLWEHVTREQGGGLTRR